MDSAAKILVDLGDDMVTEILLRLPPESIFRYQSVSKQWNSLLTSPVFLSHYSIRFHHRQRTWSPHNLLGFFLPEKSFTLDAPRVPFLPTQPRIGPESFSSDLGSFVASSNGLVLCECKLHPRSYHILNPVTRKHVSLPRPKKYGYQVVSVGFSCDEDGDDLTPRYQVVIVYVSGYHDLDKQACIETYSSETKEWRESVLIVTSGFHLIRNNDAPPFALNGVFYWWLRPAPFLAVYDPHNKLGFNKDGNHSQLLQLPDYPAYPTTMHVLNQAPDGRQILGLISDRLMRIWELSRGELGFSEQEWVLINEVPCEKGLELVALIPSNPLILLVRLERSMFQYNMETNLKKHILLLPDMQRRDHQPFYEPISFSSYLLA